MPISAVVHASQRAATVIITVAILVGVIGAVVAAVVAPDAESKAAEAAVMMTIMGPVATPCCATGPRPTIWRKISGILGGQVTAGPGKVRARTRSCRAGKVALRRRPH